MAKSTEQRTLNQIYLNENSIYLKWFYKYYNFTHFKIENKTFISEFVFNLHHCGEEYSIPCIPASNMLQNISPAKADTYF